MSERTRENLERGAALWEQEGVVDGQVRGIDPTTGLRMVGNYNRGKRVGTWVVENMHSGEILQITYESRGAGLLRRAWGFLLRSGKWLLGAPLSAARAMATAHPLLTICVFLYAALAVENAALKLYRLATSAVESSPKTNRTSQSPLEPR